MGNDLTGSEFAKLSNQKLVAAFQTQAITDMTLSEITSGVMASSGKRTIEVYLHWSEYLQGEWSTRESSEFNKPSPVVVKGASNFDSQTVFVHVSKEPNENGEERGVYVHLGGTINMSFYLAGRNSAPEIADYNAAPPCPYPVESNDPTRYRGTGTFKVKFNRRITTEDGKPPVETIEAPDIFGQGRDYTLLPCNNDISKVTAPPQEAISTENPEAVVQAIERGLSEITSLMKPVFYQDNEHTLFIEPSVEEKTIEEWQGWVTSRPQPETDKFDWDDLKYYVKPIFPKPKLHIPIDPDDFTWQRPIELESLNKLQSGEDWLVNPVTGLSFGGEVIGPGGRTGLAILPAGELAGAFANGATPVNVHAGSELAMGDAVVALKDGLSQVDMTQTTGAVSIVGSSGLNSALGQNFATLNRSVFGADRRK